MTEREREREKQIKQHDENVTRAWRFNIVRNFFTFHARDGGYGRIHSDSRNTRRLMRQKAILFVSMLETAASRSWRLRSAKRLIRFAAGVSPWKKKNGQMNGI